MKVSYGTDVGCVRKNNQDSVYVCELDGNSGLYIVADGMGGYEGGELASSSAVKLISEYIKKEFKNTMSDEQIKDMLCTSVSLTCKEIYKTAQNKIRFNGMGTTVVVCIIVNNKLYTASVGDSRCYVYTSNRLYQITRDHSLVADLVERGLITKDEARIHPQKNVITRAVGSEINVTADIFVNDLFSGDIVLICSDGLHTMVEEEKIKKILDKKHQDVAQKLIDEANKNGGKDNITVITVKILDEV